MLKKATVYEWVMIFLVAAAALVAWFATADLPVPRWEPIGPAALPRALAVLLGIFLAAMIGEIITRQESPRSAAAYPKRPGRAALMILVTIISVGLMAFRVVGFRIAAFLIFTAGGVILTGFTRTRLRRLRILIIVGIVLAAGLHALFVYVFVTNLP